MAWKLIRRIFGGGKGADKKKEIHVLEQTEEAITRKEIEVCKKAMKAFNDACDISYFNTIDSTKQG